MLDTAVVYHRIVPSIFDISYKQYFSAHVLTRTATTHVKSKNIIAKYVNRPARSDFSYCFVRCSYICLFHDTFQ